MVPVGWAGVGWEEKGQLAPQGPQTALDLLRALEFALEGFQQKAALSEWNLRAIARHLVGGWNRRVSGDRSWGRSGPELVEVRPAEKGRGSWYARKDERKAALPWKEFWPQKAHEIEGQKWGL